MAIMIDTAARMPRNESMTPQGIFPAFAVLLLLSVPWLRAQEQTTSLVEGLARDIHFSDRMTGDWGGARATLAEHGVDCVLAYTGEAMTDLSGGLRRGTAAEGLWEMGFVTDLEKLLGWKGGTFHVFSYWLHGASPTFKYVGDIQGVSNIDGFDTLRLNELWLQQEWLDNRLSLRFGQLAEDEEFMIGEYSSLFINGAFGDTVTVSGNLPVPTYPMSAPGIRLRTDPVDFFYFQAAVYDGDVSAQNLNDTGTRININRHDGFFSIYEMGCLVNHEKNSKSLPGSYKFGAWYHTGSFGDQLADADHLSLADPASSGTPVFHQGNYGLYGMADQMVYREDAKSKHPQGLGLFFTGGSAPNDRNLVSLQLAGGLHYTGLLPGRDEDLLGLAVTHVDIGDNARQFDRDTNAFNGTDNAIRDYETTMELTYRYVVNEWCFLQPDVQWVLHPGGSPAVGDAVVAGMRFQVLF